MKNVLILGATSDLGQALALEFARHGYTITLAARDPKKLEDAVRDFEVRFQQKPEVVAWDGLAMETHEAFYNSLPVKPDVTLCVLGYLGDQSLAEKDFREAQRIMDTNYTGAVSILEVVARDYAQRRCGCIIGISSVAGIRGRAENYFYGSAKAGFSAYLSGLRQRLFRSNVHVVTVLPGFMRTKMIAHRQTPPAITAQPDQAARDIYRAYEKRRNVVYTLWLWRWIMLIVKLVPEFLFKKMGK